MRSRVALLAAAFVSVAAGPPSSAIRHSDDYARLQGTWAVVSAMRDRRWIEPTPTTWTINGDRLTVVMSGRKYETRFTLNPLKRPAWLTFAENPLCYYNAVVRIQDGSLQVCMATAINGSRPRHFDASVKGNMVLHIFKRVLPPPNRPAVVEP
jgi:uncharacterized protein (TIGR03067 family)